MYIPEHPTLDNFREALSTDFFLRALLNSVIVAAAVTLISLAIGVARRVRARPVPLPRPLVRACTWCCR